MKNKISIIIGSKSDYKILEPGIELLKKFNIQYNITISSAHRSLKNTIKVVEKLQRLGTDVFIVCAGYSAHLPGVVAALTIKPVIGVPVGNSVLKGLDSILSIVQMPSGIPVATIGIDSIQNACILAIEILALMDNDLREKLIAYRKDFINKIKLDNKSIQKKN